MAVNSTIWIDAPVETVWSVLADLGSIDKWNPGVAESRTTSETAQGDGATRHCDLDDKNYLEERAFDWREGEGYKIDVTETSLPLKSNIVTFAIVAEGHGTRVNVTADYVLKFGPIGAIMDMLFAKRQSQQGFDDMLTGLKHHVETGELIGDTVPALVSA